MRSQHKQAASKQVHILARYTLKRDGKPNGMVCYLVLSSDGVTEYCTTLVNGKATGCSCKATKPCYHMAQLDQIEAMRMPAQAMRTPATVLANVAQEQCSGDIIAAMLNAPLNSNRPFSLMR